MKSGRVLSFILGSLLLCNPLQSTAEEESEFSKQLQRLAAEALWELGKEILKEAAQPDVPMSFKEAFLTGKTGGVAPSFELNCKRLQNNTRVTMREIGLAVWSTGVPFEGGKIDGVFLGGTTINGVLEKGFGFSELKRTITIDVEKAKAIQTLKGSAQRIVVTVVGKSESDSQKYIKGWANFGQYDFSTNGWVKK